MPPKPQGITSGHTRFGPKQVGYKPMPLGQAKALGELGGSLFFFTPAILYLKIGMHDGVFADFQNSLGKDVAFYHHRFNAQMFSGLTTPDGNSEWEYVLYAIPSEHKKAFLEFMNSIVMLRENGPGNKPVTVKVGLQNLQIEDPLVYDRAILLPPVIPRIDIVVLGADTNIGILYLTPGSPAYLTAGDPSIRMQQLTDDILMGKDPHAADDAVYFEELKKKATEKPDDQT